MSDNEKETQVAEETQNTQAAAESNNEDRKSRRGQRGEGRRGERRNRREESHENEMLDRVVTINRVSKTHKGGRTFSFAALVVVGDGKGTVGVGYGKSREVPAAIAKGQLDAKKHMFNVPRVRGTVTHPVIGHDAAGTVLLRPAAPGTFTTPCARKYAISTSISFSLSASFRPSVKTLKLSPPEARNELTVTR